MDNIYIEYNFTFSPKEPISEILIAELGNVGFESFVETENGVTAYIQKTDWSAEMLADVFVLNSDEFSIEYNQNEVPQTNWNAEWEKNFEPIQVDDLVSIRAPFHENPNLKYDIVIEPKMSFGTGHHETTHMMVQHLLKLDLENKKVLDMGCGTGILAIFAEMKGAKPLDAIDIDNWCYLNSLENIKRNNSKNINIFEGEVEKLMHFNYDNIFANINLNVLLNDICIYAKMLNKNGVLYLSGFYKKDINKIEQEARSSALKLIETKQENDWVSLKLSKVSN